MSPTFNLDGATRLYPIIGDPIAQVKSPAGVSETLQQAGLNALVVPMHISASHFAALAGQLTASSNVDGMIITVPHKFSASQLCATVSNRAHFLGAVNTIRRNANGTWHGDMFDGLGYVSALRKNGCEPRGKKVLLLGAGGAGSAIAHALAEAQVAQLAVFDSDAARCNTLLQRLAQLELTTVSVGSRQPQGFDVVINATPMGMSPMDSAPVDIAALQPHMFVGDVITAPVITPLLLAAQSLGCAIQTGADMFAAVKDMMVAFLLETAVQHSPVTTA